MKTLKILTIIAVTGLTGAMAQGMQQQGDCGQEQNMRHGQNMDRGQNMGKRQNMNQRQRINQGHRQGSRYKAHPNRRINRLLRNLDLSDTQKTQLKEIRRSMWQARKAQKKELRGSTGLKKFVSVDGFDKANFILASEERTKKMSKVRGDMMEKIIAVLTPEQRITLVEKLNRQGKGKRHQRQ